MTKIKDKPKLEIKNARVSFDYEFNLKEKLKVLVSRKVTFKFNNASIKVYGEVLNNEN